MAKLLSNFRTTFLLSIVLAGVMIFAFGRIAPGGFDLGFAQAVFRWVHVVAGILWIGLLYYFNFVQIRVMPAIPAELKPEIETGLHAFDLLKASPENLDWFYVSPPADFGSWLSTPSKGTYVLGGDVLQRDAAGNSTISADDLALAIVDEIETPAHHRSRFTAIA